MAWLGGKIHVRKLVYPKPVMLCTTYWVRQRALWAIGLLAAGQSSTMTGTYAGQFVMEGFLQLKLAAWKRVALTRGIALVPAVLVSFASDTNPAAGDQLGEWLNVLQSIQLPFALLPLLHFTSSRRHMGDFANGFILQIVVWVLASFCLCVNIYLIATFVTDPNKPSPHAAWFYVFICIMGVVYFAFIAYIVREDIRRFITWLRDRKAPQEGTLLETNDTSLTGGNENGASVQSQFGAYNLIENP